MTDVSKAKAGIIAGLAGAAALIAVCIPCCLSLAGPVLAWLGLAGFGAIAAGWYFVAASAAVSAFALGAAAMLYVRFRRGTSCQARPVKSTCACGTACKS